MTSPVRDLLASFDQLSERDRREAAAEILRRMSGADLPPLDDESLVAIAALTFRELDDREAADGRP